MSISLYQGNNIEILKNLPDNFVDSVVTCPPYGLRSMVKKWDQGVPSVEFWMEVYRVLKPGGHVLAFSGTRTYHRMVVSIEDASFEIRDQIAWLYGSGSHESKRVSITAHATHEADLWADWSTALKPAIEPIVMARKPLEGTVAENILAHRTGALNVDGCRVRHATSQWPLYASLSEGGTHQKNDSEVIPWS